MPPIGTPVDRSGTSWNRFGTSGNDVRPTKGEPRGTSENLHQLLLPALLLWFSPLPQVMGGPVEAMEVLASPQLKWERIRPRSFALFDDPVK